jgi:hypothetical protein
MGLGHSPRIITDGMVLCLDAANPRNFNLTAVEVLVVAGGGGGGGYHGGGGGGGGVIYSSSHSITPGSAITATVGAGGDAPTSSSNTGNPGGNSVFGALTAIGGGAGITQGGEAQARNNGGSGGGGCDGSSSVNHPGGSGTSGQGFKGGDVFGDGYSLAVYYGTAGGGGAGGAGGTGGILNGGFGGPGLGFNISGTSTYYAGGGGGTHLGSSSITNYGIGGIGGGGTGGISPSPHNSAFRSSTSGSPNTGGGGGGHLYSGLGGGAGGSGIVIVRYQGPQKAIGGTVTSVGGDTIHTFTTSGTFTPLVNTNASAVLGLSDLSGNRNFGTSANSPTYSSANGGSISFDGTDDYVDLGSDKVFKTTGGWTVESWVNYDVIPTTYNNTTSPANFIGSETITHNSWYWSVLESKLSLWNISPGVWKHGSTILQAYTWYNAVLVCYNSGTSYQMYLNGIAEGGDHTAYSWNASYSGLNIRYIGRGNSANVRLVDGKIPITKVYDRALSAAEVSQNFNALRGRYGL